MAQAGVIDPEDPESRRVGNVERNFNDLKLHFVAISVNSASNLKAADHGLKGGNSDPFLEVIANKQKFTTKTIMKNLNPAWNESTTFCFFDLITKIDFNVYDWDKGSKHDLIGQCSLDTSKFFEANNNGFAGDIALTKKGSINVKVSGRLIIPRELEDRCADLALLKNKQSQELNGLNTQCDGLKTTNTQLTHSKEIHGKDLEGLKVNYETLRMQEYSIKQECEKARDKISKVQREMESIGKKEKQFKDQINDMKDEMNTNQKSLETQESNRHSTLEKMQEYRQQILKT